MLLHATIGTPCFATRDGFSLRTRYRRCSNTMLTKQKEETAKKPRRNLLDASKDQTTYNPI
jgi:hypothetical protein